ncbi:hypothetical protein BD769DRAFT_1681464 [Suillus cothurnatus]|nr:hypothetical protein BD769DRAFT_1681464 [Suillus cothurnatus]
MSAFSKLHHLSLLRTPNTLAALLLDADTTMPHPTLTSILVCPVTQPEVLKLKQLENVGAVLTGDIEGLSPSIPVETITGSYYSDWAISTPCSALEATFDRPEHCYFGYWQLILLPLVLLQYEGL